MANQSLLDANGAFYIAFAEGDIDAMEQLWAVDAPSICIHPGWPALMGRVPILESWRAILASPPPVRVRQPTALDHGDGVALVHCVEEIGDERLAAVNGFAWEDGSWRMVLHQSSAIADAFLDRSDGALPPD